ncbi:acid-sensing ion channel 1C-like [Clytia hemisphaerica]|uniref:acid-sensing ion channel 1C-like n=1 Tax=Clytia hemisphaerica TaxID=252671 RepID=UPI0034D7A641
MVHDFLLLQVKNSVMNQEKDEKPRKSVAAKWEDFCSETTLHGFRAAFYSKNIYKRYFWRVLLVCATVLAIFLFYGVVDAYKKYEFKVSKEINFSMDDIEFPRVTICNLNSLSKMKLVQLGFTEEADDLIDFYHKMRAMTLNISDPDTKRILNLFYAKGMNTTHEIISAFDLGKNEMLNDEFLAKLIPKGVCSFEDQKCNMDNFTEIYSTKFGKCLVFPQEDSQPLMSTTQGDGLSLFLNIHEDEMLDSRSIANGLVVFIHPHEETFQSALSKRIFIQPGTISDIHVTVSKLRSLPAPYKTDCGKKALRFIDESYGYSANLCAIDCISEMYYSTCKCLPSELKMFVEENIEECSMEKFDCFTKVYRGINNGRMYDKCQQKCPAPCYMESFTLQAGQIKIGTKFMYDKLALLMNISVEESKDFVSHNFVGIRIAYGDVMYTEETLTPSVDWKTLLATIGGSLGLCLGCSFITCCEFLVFCITYALLKRKESSKSAKKTVDVVT